MPQSTRPLRPWHREAGEVAPVTRAIIVVNFLLFALEETWGGSQSTDTLARMGAVVTGVAVDHPLARVFAYGFLHIGVLHLAVNMFSLWNLGVALERLLGRPLYAVLYFGAIAVGGAGVSALERLGVTAGASGGLFGLLAAVAVLSYDRYRAATHPYERIAMRNQLLLLVVPNALISLLPGVSLVGHAAGFGFGLVFMGVLRALAPMRKQRARAMRVQRVATTIALASAVFSVVSFATIWATNRPWIVLADPSSIVR